jgi:hypothetical protein
LFGKLGSVESAAKPAASAPSVMQAPQLQAHQPGVDAAAQMLAQLTQQGIPMGPRVGGLGGMGGMDPRMMMAMGQYPMGGSFG